MSVALEGIGDIPESIVTGRVLPIGRDDEDARKRTGVVLAQDNILTGVQVSNVHALYTVLQER